jgi:hypothetical protein
MRTFSASTQAPDKLSCILINEGQHPEYPTLFVHSNLHVLQSLSSEGISVDPVPVFKQVWGRGFKFNSWVRIVQTKHLAPFSDELKEMLGRKWRDKERNRDAWQESLEMPWVEVRVEKVVPQPIAPLIGRAER